MIKILSVLAVALGFATAANAHHVWLEQTPGKNATIRFGEFADNLREASPGLLDGFVKPTATLLSAQGERSADAAKTATGFALPFGAGRGQSIVAEETRYPLRKTKQGEQEMASWFQPGARLITDFSVQKPKLALDLVPAGRPGAFTLYFKGQPLPKTKVELLTQSGWSRHAYTDEQGNVQIDMPWKGQYVAEVRHTDRTPGERDGEKYDQVSYVTSVTYVKADGLTPIPAGPVKPANPPKN
ncbi:MAG: DUF4198 domain-containing protein [Burkholderiaceae bacterium]